MKRINFAHLKQHMYCYQCSSMKICLLPVFLVFTSPDVIWLSCVFAACLFLGWDGNKLMYMFLYPSQAGGHEPIVQIPPENQALCISSVGGLQLVCGVYCEEQLR